MSKLHHDYPWTTAPLISGAPMRLIALSSLAVEISSAGGLGFIGAGSDASTLDSLLSEAKSLIISHRTLQKTLSETNTLPIGIGILLWAGESLLEESLPLIEKHRPAAIWLFAPNSNADLVNWTTEVRRVTQPHPAKIWIQTGTVSDAVQITRTCRPDVLVVQGNDAGGHGLQKCAGLVPLVPEVNDAVTALCEAEAIPRPAFIAAGGIMDGRGVAAALALGAEGVTLGTRYLAAPEANLAKGYRDAVLGAADGGVTTARGKLYDSLRGTTDWPEEYGGRGVLNHSWFDAARGMSLEDNKRMHDEAVKKGDDGWGINARLTTYAGAGVGLVREVKGAAEITVEVREGARQILKERAGRFS